ncbi:MAG TPA: hypothetical protein VNM48_03980 [Chloroflexota bacterium]|nr:hypothetical protein [Chloroflexota bacterium]
MAYRKRSGVFADTGGIGLAGSGGDAGSRCGAHLPWSDGIVYWDYGGLVDGVTELAAPGLTFGDDLWAFTVGPRGMEIWQNGRLRASNTSNPTRTAGAAAFALGAHATTYTDHAEWSFAAIARTQLSSATLAQLTNLPAVQSRLLWEPLQRYWFPLGGPQFARPNADTSTGTWTDQAGGSAALYAAIDEASIAVNDADYLQSALSPASDAYTAALTSVTDPAVSTGHIVRYRYRKDAAGGDAVSLVVTLKQGATTIATWTHSTVDGSLGWATAVQTLTAAQADAITDYATLSLQFTASSP